MEFSSTVIAREMRFREVPENRVAFAGHPDHESHSGSERIRLPDAASPHVTYRYVRVDYRIAAKLKSEADLWWRWKDT